MLKPAIPLQHNPSPLAWNLHRRRHWNPGRRRVLRFCRLHHGKLALRRAPAWPGRLCAGAPALIRGGYCG